MNVLNGIKNFLLFINDNWMSILVIIGLIISIIKKIKTYLSKSDNEKILIAKQQIKETMLRFVTDAEKDYDSWMSAGEIKRAQVIEEIFLTYPILSKVTNQESLIQWIDDTIDEALETMRVIFAENADKTIAKQNNNLSVEGDLSSSFYM